MTKVDIAGLKIDAITKKEFLDTALARVKTGEKTFVTTPYSEFLYYGFQNPEVFNILNKANFAVADGIGIFWAKKYLELPLTAKSYWGKILQAAWQMKYSLAAIIFNPSWIKSALPEKIVGADLVWDLAELAAKNNLSVFLLGGFGNTSELAANRLNDYASKKLGRAFNQHWSNKNPGDPSVIEDVNNAAPDLLMVAYGPIKQEEWIMENLPKLNVKLAIGVGGSFDYIAGIKSAPPKFVRYSGLEWLWRLITQPYRFKRIINATFGLMSGLWHYKVFNSLPLRPNAAIVIINNKKEILIFQRKKQQPKVDIIGSLEKDKYENYWQLPQGGIENGEDVISAAKREVLEETGLKNLEFIKLSQKTNSYIWNNALRKFRFNTKYAHKGQIQNVVYFKLSSDQINFKPEDSELINYKWVSFDGLSQEVHPERATLIKIVSEDLKDLA